MLIGVMAKNELPRPQVLRIAPRPEVVRDLVRQLAQNTSNIQWRQHALDRMVERDITDEMALEVLRRGDPKGEITPGQQPDELNVKMVRHIKGRREVGVVVVVIKSLKSSRDHRGMGGLGMTKVLSFVRVNQPETGGEPLHYRACGLDDVYLFNGFKVETIDGEEYVTIEDLDGLWKTIGLHLVTIRKELEPKEIRFLRHHMNFTQAELAAQMRVTDQTVARWEKGVNALQGPEDMLLRVLFLSSKIAQPEGGELLTEFGKLSDQIVERDAPAPRPTMFEHGKRKWKESKRVLEVA